MGARHLGLGFETTYGTAVAPTVFFEVRRESLIDTPNFEEVPSIRTVSTRQMVELNSAIKNDVEMTFDFQTVGYLLKLFFGIAPTTTGAGPFTHTFPPSGGLAADSRIGISGTFEAERVASLNAAWRYAGCKLPGLAIAGSTDGAAVLTASILGKSETTPAPASPTYLDFDLAKPSQLDVLVDAASAGAKSFNLNLAWPLDEPYGLGATTFLKEPDDDGPLSVMGDFVVFFDSITDYTSFATRADVDVQITLDDGTHSLTINLNKCRLTAVGLPTEGRKRLMATFSFLSFFDTVPTENIQCVLVNDVASLA